MLGRLKLTRSMKRLVESPMKQTAFFFMVFVVVWHMFPGRWNGSDGVGGSGWPGWGTGVVYSLWTRWMLWPLIIAMLVVPHEHDTAILIWLLSAAFWADWFCVSVVGCAFWECGIIVE